MTKALNRFFRATSLVVTDRRWAAPLSAMALGFGLFIGVAIGPNAAGTLAGVPPIVEIPDFSGGTSEGGGEGGGGSAAALAGPAEGGSEGGGGALGALPSAPLATGPIEPAPVPAPSPKPAKTKREAPPEQEETVYLKGVVVHANQAAGSYALAIKGGELVSVHAAELPAPGTKMSLVAGRLANDTFIEAEPRDPEGTTKRASFRGAVTFVDPDPAAPGYTVSGRGASLPVHIRPDPSGAVPPLPALGAYATVTVGIEAKPAAASTEAPPAATTPPAPAPSATDPAAVTSPACAPDPGFLASKAFVPAALLWQSGIEIEEGEPSTYLDLAGIVSAVCPSQAQLLISADGMREGEGDLLLSVPAKIATNKLKIGDSVLATATIEADGSLALSGLISDERIKGADDPSSAQGDLKRR